ncbi:zona pellucida sperm-binding protein 3-like [Menidia menidia]
MDCNLRRVVSWWIVIFHSAFTLTEARLHRGFQNPVRAHDKIQPRLSPLERKQRVELEARPRPVAVRCLPGSMEVVVRADLFESGLRVDGAHLRLGLNPPSDGGECGAVPSGEDEFTLLTWLTECGTKLSSTEEMIVYSNVLVYSPEPSSDGLLRLDGATIPVECHYERRYMVGSSSLYPTWIPFISTTSVDGQIDFTFQIMTDDWQSDRGSYTFYLGHPIHFEVSAVMGNHMPLRVYVDHCVATTTADAEATPRYDFIENHGCLTDAQLTKSNSHFLPRVEEHKLRFQLDAFNFYQEPSNEVYITCHLKAVLVTLPVSSKNRACSLINNRWQSVDGNDQACRNCDSPQWVEEHQTTKPPKATLSTEARPSTMSKETLAPKKAEYRPASYISFNPLHKGQQVKPSEKLIKSNTDYKRQQTIQLGPLTVLPEHKYVTSATDYKTVLSQKNKPT